MKSETLKGWGSVLVRTGLILWFAMLGICPSVQAQTLPLLGGESSASSSVEVDSKPTEESIRKRIQEIDARIQSLQSADLQTGSEEEPSEPLPRERIHIWSSIRARYQRTLDALLRQSDQQKELADLRSRITRLEERGVPEPPPYTLSFYDRMLNELNAAEEDRDNAADSADLARRRLEEALQRLDGARQKARRIRDRSVSEFLSDGGAVSEKETFSAESELARAEAAVVHERVQVSVLESKQALENLRVAYYRKALDQVRKDVAFDREDLDQQLQQIEIQKTALQDQLDNLRQEQRQRSEAYTAVLDENFPKDDTIRQAVQSARETWDKTYQTTQEQIFERLQMLDRQQRIWSLRYQVVQGRSEYSQAAEWRDEAEANLDDLQEEIRLQLKYLRNLQNRILALEKQAAEADLGSEFRRYYREQLNGLYRLKDERTDHIASASALVMQEQKLTEEIDLKYARLPMGEIWNRFLDRFAAFLNLEIWVIDNRPLTVRKLIAGLVVLLLGLAAAKFLIRMIHVRMMSEKLRQSGTGKTLEKISTYFIYSMVILFVLRIVNIPLEAFAFLGGALALGFGLGAQNLFNNFLSWFIIMAERTLTIGDLVEIEGLLGKVEDIGARHTRIRTGENIDILVPNSSFLEKNVVNWTMTDRKIRSHVTVGVVYGTPFRKVEELLLQAAEENPKVLKFPGPFVLFTDFGDNALIFEVHFWLYVERVVERRMVQSALRFRIGELFEAAGLVIAFPQRDVHLDSMKPIDVRVLSKEGSNDPRRLEKTEDGN